MVSLVLDPVRYFVERVVRHSVDPVLVECSCMRLHTEEANSMKQEVCDT